MAEDQPAKMTLGEELFPSVGRLDIGTAFPSFYEGSLLSRPASAALSTSQSSVKRGSASQTPKSEDHEDMVPPSVEIEIEPGKAPKLSRKSQKHIISRAPPLFDDLPDATPEAVTKFTVIKDCMYGSKYMGSSEHDALGCDCHEEWSGGENHACGEDSDCINRATKMECLNDDCGCGAACQNQRFQRKAYANVSVIKTEKKGYGLRADSDLLPNDFIFEYIGEVINEPTFRRRTIQYNDEGIKHFYFMSLTKSEFVDATKKGNLGRFCNHSCNPNCYVDKWVVGDKLRMGIFAERHIKAGEELVFNYNVDRYGADPQPCYCGEPNCTGFIGGKTQTERATKLSHTTIEALGIEDGDGWDTAVAKKPRKKKTGEDDEEYVNNVQPKGLDERGVTKVMATLMQCKEKWIAVKLLDRIQRCDDDRVRNRVIRMHGYQILRTTLTTFIDDNNVILQILDILYKFPRLTRNKIADSKIEQTMETLVNSEHEDVAEESKRLLDVWGKLETAYRIPRKKFDPNAPAVQQSVYSEYDRRANDDRRDSQKPAETPSKLNAPTGPKNLPARPNFPASAPRAPAALAALNAPRRPFIRPIPHGWFTALDAKGNTYYYNKVGDTTWQRPRQPAPEPPPKPKVNNQKKSLQDIIDSITKAEKPKLGTGSPAVKGDKEPVKEKKEKKREKWRSLPEEKQMKVYENTLFPHIKSVMDKFKHRLPREDLKKFGKEIGKKIVSSDFKNKRVEDPTSITTKQERKVKAHVREFFEKAVIKKVERDRKAAEKKADRARRESANGVSQTPSVIGDAPTPDAMMGGDEDLDIEMSDNDEDVKAALVESVQTPRAESRTPSDGQKRKLDDFRDDDVAENLNGGDAGESSSPHKRRKESPPDEGTESPGTPMPPPPPPPPAGDMIMEAESPCPEEGESPPEDVPMNEGGLVEDEEARVKREQEEALMRENEEALIRENEEAMRDAEMKGVDTEKPIKGSIDEVDVKIEAAPADIMTDIKADTTREDFKAEDGFKIEEDAKLTMDVDMADRDGVKAEEVDEGKKINGVNGSGHEERHDRDRDQMENLQRERKEVLSH